MTELVVQDMLGVELVIGEVHIDGVRVSAHCWNRQPDGSEVHLTAAVFLPVAQVVGGHVVVRPVDGPHRLRAEYELLRDQVVRGVRTGWTDVRETPSPRR